MVAVARRRLSGHGRHRSGRLLRDRAQSVESAALAPHVRARGGRRVGHPRRGIRRARGDRFALARKKRHVGARARRQASAAREASIRRGVGSDGGRRGRLRGSVFSRLARAGRGRGHLVARVRVAAPGEGSGAHRLDRERDRSGRLDGDAVPNDGTADWPDHRAHADQRRQSLPLAPHRAIAAVEQARGSAGARPPGLTAPSAAHYFAPERIFELASSRRDRAPGSSVAFGHFC